MEAIYDFGVFVNLILFGAYWVVALFSILFTHARAFVNDEKVTEWPRFLIDDGEGYSPGFDEVAQLFIGAVIVIIGTFAWPLAWFGIIVVVGLLTARKAVRFKKVYEKHTHDANTGAIKSSLEMSSRASG